MVLLRPGGHPASLAPQESGAMNVRGGRIVTSG
jgi:hypothetical protein